MTGMEEHPDSQAFLLLGKAGVGKSAIAHRIVQEAKQQGRLGAFFCFSAGIGPGNFFRTIARRLADLEPAYASALMADTDSTLKTTSSLTRQLQDLLTKPFKTLSGLGPIALVVDALDECAVDRDELIRCLHENIHLFPKNIRFFITSRPSEAQLLRRCPWVYTHNLEVDESTRSDIYRFVETKLADPITKEWLRGFDELKLDAIADAAEGLFQYAAVVCKEIMDAEARREKSPLQVYTRLVQSGSQGLDALYLAILNNAFAVSDSARLQAFHRLMGWILHAQDHLSKQMLVDFESVQMADKMSDVEPALSEETSTDYGLIASILHYLGALLSGTEEREGKVFPLHSSFRDFLLDKSRSAQFHIGLEPAHHISFTITCLQVMQQGLHFNMASLESSYLLNSDVPDFGEQVKAGVSQTLTYACLYWTEHLKRSEMTEADIHIRGKVWLFTLGYIAFWLEVLALKRRTDCAEKSMHFIFQWSKVSQGLPGKYQNKNLIFTRN